MQKRILTLVSLLLLQVTAHAQYNLKENSFWAFGSRHGLDFSGTAPLSSNVSLVSLGGSASVCDTGGQLLFYTQGDTIWNKNHNVMPNGAGLIAPYASNAGGTQSDQGQLIVPVIGNPDRYYVFSMQNVGDFYFSGDPMACRLFYSVVDMTLDNGLGDVVAGQKMIPLDSMLTGNKMIAIPGDSCNIWLLTHTVTGNTFKAFEIGINGINTTPVTSVTGNLSGGIAYTEGKLRISPDRTKLFVPSGFGSSLAEVGADLCDFDPATGIVSNAVLLDTSLISFSGCFSPDNSKLYVIGSDPTFGFITLSQFDLSQPTTAAIISSKTYLDSSNMYNYVRDARLAPDGKVYVSLNDPADSLSRIDFPDLAGTACGYHRNIIPLNHDIAVGNGNLPNEYVKMIRDTIHTSSDSTLNASGSVILRAPAGYASYTWSTGASAANITVTAIGTYWVTYGDYCTDYTDTFKVTDPLSVNDISGKHSFIVYPNPATRQITLEIAGQVMPGIIRITDVLGRNLIERSFGGNGQVIDISTLANGMYTVHYFGKDGITRLQRSLVISR